MNLVQAEMGRCATSLQVQSQEACQILLRLMKVTASVRAEQSGDQDQKVETGVLNLLSKENDKCEDSEVESMTVNLQSQNKLNLVNCVEGLQSTRPVLKHVKNNGGCGKIFEAEPDDISTQKIETNRAVNLKKTKSERNVNNDREDFTQVNVDDDGMSELGRSISTNARQGPTVSSESCSSQGDVSNELIEKSRALSDKEAGKVVGKRGVKIKHTIQESGADICINNNVMNIKGERSCVEKAVGMAIIVDIV